MQKTAGVIIAVMLMLMQGGMVSAATRSYTLQVNVPTAAGFSMSLGSVQASASGVSIAASSVTVSSNVWTALASNATTLSFDTMTFNSTYGYWAPNHYFAVDVGTIGGSGNLTTVVTYAEGTNQNSAMGGHGLGYKGIATFMKVTGSGTSTKETSIAAHGKKRLIDLTGETVTPAQVSGGWLRIYLGIATGASGEPAGSELFTNADHAGTYDGAITFTGTLS